MAEMRMRKEKSISLSTGHPIHFMFGSRGRVL